MIFNVENTKGKKVRVLDGMGKHISYCSEYDTETRMVKTLVVAHLHEDRPTFVVSNGELARVTVHLPDSVIEVDGVRY